MQYSNVTDFISSHMYHPKGGSTVDFLFCLAVRLLFFSLFLSTYYSSLTVCNAENGIWYGQLAAATRKRCSLQKYPINICKSSEPYESHVIGEEDWLKN